jgi:LuxR family maltose regulon positive regulatory protein
VQHFLLQTSVLERLNGALCQAVTGRAGSASLLEQLYSANLFLVSLDDERQWYRYHHLFSDLLRDLLPARCPGQAATLTQTLSGLRSTRTSRAWWA